MVPALAVATAQAVMEAARAALAVVAQVAKAVPVSALAVTAHRAGASLSATESPRSFRTHL